MTPLLSADLPSVVQFGAGAIGRGFVGQLWADGGFETVFVDLDLKLIDRLNTRRTYPLRLLAPDGAVADRVVGPVRALNGRDAEAVAAELAACAFACTAAGVNAFRSLAPTLALGIASRVAAGNADPLNVLCCENQARAGELLRAAVDAALPDDTRIRAYFADSVAFVDASVGRMVPPPTDALRAEDPLLVAAEPYATLPIDGAAWRGALPPAPGLTAESNFAGYVARKLFTHNGGHAALAYHGYRAGHQLIYQAAEDPAILAEVLGFWRETGAALIAAHGFDPAEQKAHETDLLARFRNRTLGDTVLRVGRDPLRKLRPDDRLVGAALLCEKWTPEAPPEHVCAAIAAALRFDPESDAAAAVIQKSIAEKGLSATVEEVCKLSADTQLAQAIARAFLYLDADSSSRERSQPGGLALDNASP